MGVRALAVCGLGAIMAAWGSGCVSGDRAFGEDVAFLRAHTKNTVVLGSDPAGPRAVVVGDYQGRVMTSSAGGDKGLSYGWINYELIEGGEVKPHIMPWGGEDRFWLGPEGGQFALFFEGGDEFTLEDWQTPAVIDTEAYELVSSTSTTASFTKDTSLANYSGSRFDMRIDRDIVLLTAAQVEAALAGDGSGPRVDLSTGAVRAVGYESRNRVTNTGSGAWTKETGLVSIWILGMFKPGERTTVVIPFRMGHEDELGRVVNDEYFGKVPADRLVVRDGAMFFRGDGRYRSKIGLSPSRSVPVCGSWDAEAGVLTIVQFTNPGPSVTDYVNSMWALQDNPFGGDVINSYNDGPSTPGAKSFGGFYELETSSPGLALAPGQAGFHMSRTMHIEGERAELDRIAREALGAGLEEIEAAFGG